MATLSDGGGAASNGGAWRWASALADPATRITFIPRGLPRRIATTRCDRMLRRRDTSIMAIHRGWMRLAVDGIRLDPGPGDVVLVPEGCFMDRFYEGERVTQDLRFTARGAALPPLSPQVIRHDWPTVDLVERLAAEIGGRHPRPLVQRLLLAQLLALFHEVRPAVRGGLSPEQRAAIESWADAHLAQAPTPADLARACGAGHDAFATRFRRSYGTSPRLWLAERRARAAADLVQHGESLTAAARRLGFADAGHLGRQIRRLG